MANILSIVPPKFDMWISLADSQSIGMNKLGKYSTLTFFIFLLLLGVIPQTRHVAASDSTVKDPLLDPPQWEISTNGDGQVTRDTGLTITSSPKFDLSGAEVSTTWQFTGDFDVQVDYKEGMGWEGPYESYRNDPHLIAAEMGIRMNGSIWSIVRYIDSRWSSEIHDIGIYYTPAGQEGMNLRFERATPSNSGKFRVVRNGSDVVFQTYRDSAWLGFYSVSGIDKPVSVYLSASSVWANHTFSTIFENFQINSGETDYIPSRANLLAESTFWEKVLYPGGEIEQGPPLTISSSDTYYGSGGRYQTLSPFIGNFDVQVDFRIGAGWWDPVVHDPGYIDAADLGIYINEGEPSAQIMYYVSDTGHTLGVSADRLTTVGGKWIESNNVTSGSYRIIRTGSDTAFMVDVGSGWQQLCTVVGVTLPVRIYISCGAGWNTVHSFFTYFDNFKINSGNVVSPFTATFRADGISPSYVGNVVIIDGSPYKLVDLPISMDSSSSHSYEWQSPLTQDYSRYVWVDSSGDPNVSGHTSINTNITITTHYRTQCALNITSTPGGKVTPSGLNWYDQYSFLTLTASPDPGFKFIEWRLPIGTSDAKSPSMNIYSLTGGGEVRAVFSDVTPPNIGQIGLFYPGDVSWSREVKLSAIYSDNLGVDLNSVRLKVDGENITSGASVSPYSLWYSTYLSPGTHTIELTLSDLAGNVDSKSHLITVLPLEFIIPILVVILVIGFVITLRKRARIPQSLPPSST